LILLLLQFVRGLIYDQNTRRGAMFVVLLSAMLMVFAGGTFLSTALLSRPLIFLTYWGACAWLTFCAILLALYDLLALRRRAREERRRLKVEIFRKEHEER